MLGGDGRVAYLAQKLTKSIDNSIDRHVWFGDKLADDIAGGGVYKNGTDITLYNVINGLFQQLFAEVLITDDNYVAIAENALATTAAQRAIGSTTTIDTLRKMLDARSLELQSMSEGESTGRTYAFYMTTDLYNSLKNFLEDKNLVPDSNATLLRNGEAGGITYNGFVIHRMYQWDNTIRKFQDNGTKLNLPNRILFTSMENIPIGLTNESDFETIEQWYSKDDRKIHQLYEYNMDVKHLQKTDTVFAY